MDAWHIGRRRIPHPKFIVKSYEIEYEEISGAVCRLKGVKKSGTEEVAQII